MTEAEVRAWTQSVDDSRPGIYAIVNVTSGKVYVGQQKQKGGFRARWAQHRYRLNKRGSGNDHLVAAWRKYGASSFVFVAIENCSIDELDSREAHYLGRVPEPERYNMAPIRSHMSATPEYRATQSERMKRFYAQHPEKRPSAEDTSRRARAFWGSEAGARKKLEWSIKLAGRPGTPLTDDQKQKLRKAHLGKKLSEETKRKIGLATVGHTLSAEGREKVRRSKLGKPRPPHVVRAMIEGRAKKRYKGQLSLF